jgi:hypothetical protein
METNKIKEVYGDAHSFLMAFSPEKQILVSDLDEAISNNYPTIHEICIAYGEETVKGWICAHIVNLTCFANCSELAKEQVQELSAIIMKECLQRKISELLHFFYCMKSNRLVCINGNISPVVITYNLRQYLAEANTRKWVLSILSIEENKKVFLIVEDQPKTKVYARVFRSKENAEKALEERDYRTGERLYPGCHIIERTIE